MSKTEEQFNEEKLARIARIKAQMESLSNGNMRRALETELLLAKRQSYEESLQDRRFITNN